MVKPIIIDTATGVNPHIYSADFAAILNSVDGVDCVKDYLDNLSASIISANEVRLAPGLFAIQGHYAMIPYGDYVSCAIGNGQTGYKRYDLIVARFTRTAGVDDITINVIQGTPSTGTPTIPTVTTEDLEQCGDLREFKLYLVYINGLTISSVTAQFSVLPSIGTLNTNLNELDTKVINIDKFSTTEKVVGEWTDGKPLYEVTKDLTLTNGATTSLGIANVDMVYIENSVPLCNSYVNSSDYQGYSISASGIFFSSTGQNSGKSHKITLRYTKTTD